MNLKTPTENMEKKRPRNIRSDSHPPIHQWTVRRTAKDFQIPWRPYISQAKQHTKAMLVQPKDEKKSSSVG